MAKQKGIFKLEGTIGDVTFFKTEDGYMARENSPVSAERIANDPAFQRTRENMAEFSRAGKGSKLFRSAIRTLLQNAKDKRVTGRLTARFMAVIKADITNNRGQRTIVNGDPALLQDFDCNKNAKLGTTIYAPYSTVIDRVAGTCTVDIPPFIPTEQLGAPAGTTHYKVVSMGAEIDFANEVHITDSQESGVLPWDGTATAALNLVNTVTANSAFPLFLLLGIQFFQQVNGTNYPLKNGAYNALSIVKVSGS